MTAPAQPTLPERLETAFPRLGARTDESHVVLRAFPQTTRSALLVTISHISEDSAEADALAAAIAKRYNAHAGLVAALEALVGTSENEGEVRAIEAEGMIDAADMQGYELGKCIKQARALLAEIRGQR